jgi:hypothetical protein
MKDRRRSRLLTRDRRELLRRSPRLGLADPTVSRAAHRRRHTYASLVYSSKATLDTNAGTPFYPMQAGRLVGVRLQCATAPSGADLTCDILFDGSSIYHTSSKPTIPDGALFGYVSHHQDRISFQADTKIQVQITTISSAGGPLVVELLYEPEYQ